MMMPNFWGRPSRFEPALGTAEESPKFTLAPETLHEILQTIDVGLLVLDPPVSRLRFRNPASYEILGDGLAPLPYPDLHQLLVRPLEARPDEPVQAAVCRHGNRLLGIHRHQLPGGEYCIFLRNLTEKARLEAIAQAVNTMDNTRMIFSGIRHEIGNPLNSIKVTMAVLRDNLDHFPPERIEEYIERSLVEVSRIEFLLRSLRNFSMFENLDSSEQDLNILVNEFALLAQRDLEKHGISLRCHLASRPLPIQVDPRALHQVLLNLLANSVDALAGCGRPPSLVITTYQRDHLAQLLVRDNGCGMSEEQLQHLFQPFHTTKASGNGLGLVITRKLLAMMSANVEVHSREQVGTTVAITFPLPAAGPPREPPVAFNRGGEA